MAHEGYHEPAELLSAETKDMHRAIISLIEELEAIDWYQQRADACGDEALRSVLVHNKDEEVEHAVMTLEWIRRHAAVFDTNLRTYLFTEAPITGVEDAETSGQPDERSGDEAAGAGPAPRAVVSGGSLGIGSLKAG